MKNSVQCIIIRVLGNFSKQSGILAAITLLGHTIKSFRFAASTLYQVIRTRETVLTETHNLCAKSCSSSSRRSLMKTNKTHPKVSFSFEGLAFV